MGLRFRKSVSLFPGVRLNFSKGGMSLSAGVPGFRKTINTKGQVTTTTGIPGTGLYYVETKKRNNTPKQRTTPTRHYNYELQDQQSYYEPENNITSNNIVQVDTDTLKSIHKTADDTIDWTEVLVSPIAPDETYNQDMWSYYYSVAPDILNGDIDKYLQLIYEVNPLDDLLEYGANFEFGTDSPNKIEVEYIINKDVLFEAKNHLNNTDYNDLLQDFVCSMSIRIARDMFALLPIDNTIVYTVLDNKTILLVDFDRKALSKVKFGYIDPSDTVEGFKHNMCFDVVDGFSEISRVY